MNKSSAAPAFVSVLGFSSDFEDAGGVALGGAPNRSLDAAGFSAAGVDAGGAVDGGVADLGSSLSDFAGFSSVWPNPGGGAAVLVAAGVEVEGAALVDVVPVRAEP